MFTLEDLHTWEKENSEQLDADRNSNTSEEVQMFNRIQPELSRKLWNTGCWFKEKLEELGASEEEIRSACFALGQRSVFRDPYQTAVNQLNEFYKSGVLDEGGEELSEKLNDEFFGNGPVG